MGVPKFYRWVSERYPCLSEVVKEFQIPEFDNLYLDMNGIIHVCSHPEDDNPHFRITEEKIFKDIMHYLEFLFRMIKPRKVFFMAVDGVAPRAKMNQQRGRRFRSAREAEELERKAREKGEDLPTEKRFDSNCITPGTPFMVRLQDQLKYFVVNKLSTDPLWEGVRVYLSGHETPGEGEHKIMDFIRAERRNPDYDPNTRHCLHGLDADLMMLGLATHEPHFSLLREEVRFGGKRDKTKRPATPEETTFHLLHLSLFREYLDFEFSALKDKLPFPYDLENIIDDWVLMGFLVGNDFIPHLPNLHINHDALPLLWQTYIDVLPSCGGYLNTGGHLNLDRFEKYLTALSKFDFDTFSEQVGDLKWLEAKKGDASVEQQEMLSAARKFRKNAKKAENHFAALLDLPGHDPEGYLETGLSDDDASPEELSEDLLSEEDSEDTLDDEFRHHKRAYYMDKMEYERVTPEVLKDQAEGYVRGIQWILLYYYEGVPSWSWFYPHHYAPYMSDVKDFKHMNIQFDLATPFLPFEQLMAVLPAASKELLPPAYQSLMTTASSPVIDFYPVDFSTDLNGKQQDWEAVVLIPFIDENRLLSAMKAAEVNLTPEERKRNSHGPCCLFEYSSEVLETYPSSLQGVFPDIINNHARLTKVPKDAFWLSSSEMVKGLLKGTRLDVYYPGFPTLKHIPHKSELAKKGVKVFQMNSRGYNVCLHIEEQEEPDIQRAAKEYLGKEIYVGWPHLYEAKVIAVCNEEVSHNLVESPPAKGGKSTPAQKPNVSVCRSDENTANIWHREVESIRDKYENRLGIMVGDTHVLLRALPMTGRKYIFGSHGRITMSKQFGNQPVPFVLQATVKDIAVHDPNFCQFKTLTEYLPDGSPVFMLGWPHYGCQGEVLEVDSESGRVRVNLTIFEEPKVSGVLSNQQMHEERYYSGYVASQRLGISSSLFGRMTGTILVCQGAAELAKEQQNPHKVNVGLNLKFTKRGEEIPGYTKLTDGQWSYSEKTIQVAREYMAKFPEMWTIISKADRKFSDIFYESDVIPKDSDYDLKAVSKYKETLPCHGLKSMKSGADIISEGMIRALESEADKVVEINKKRQKRVKMQVKPHLLFRPLRTAGSLIPDSSATYQLLDRVVNIRQGYCVPFGLRGTVIGIHPSEVEVNSMYEVLFDEEFSGSISIRNSTMRGYRMPPSSILNLTHGERKNGVKPALPTKSSTQHTGSQYGNQSQQYGNQSQYGSYGKQNQQYGNQSRNVTGDYSYASASQSSYQRNQQGHQGQQAGYYNQARPGNQDSFYPSWNRNQSEWNRPNQVANQKPGDRNSGPKKVENKSSEDFTGNVFNGSSGSGSQPKFVTPKVTPTGTSQRRPSQGESKQEKANSGNSDFDNIWKQLQGSAPMMPAENEKSKSPANYETSLAHAASVLPTVSNSARKSAEKDTENTNNNNSDSASTKIDVQSLFSQASKVSTIEELEKTSASKVTSVEELEKSSASKVTSVAELEKSSSTADDEKGNKGGKSKVVSNDEFAAMFKSLSEVDLSEEEDSEGKKDPEDSSDMIKKMLKISNEPGTEPLGTSPEPGHQPNKSYGRQVSIQELFEGAKKQQEQGSGSQGQGQTSKKGNQGNEKSKQHQGSQGQQQQQQQQQSYQNQKRPTLLMPQSKGGNRNPVMELMSFCQSLQIGLPMYDYMVKSGQHFCVVTLFNGQSRFSGSLCKTREEAAESAAGLALLQLKGSVQAMPGHPMMRMQGFVPPGVLPQGRQFSSPNSAFSPVSNFAGNYNYQGYGGYGQYQNPQQQRPYGQGNYQQHGRGANRSSNYGNQSSGNYGNQNQSGGSYGNPNQSNSNYGNQGYSQQYQNNQSSGRQPHHQQQTHPQNPSTNQSVFKKKEETTPLANQKVGGAGQTAVGEVKTQPTCVVSPFIPLQVTKKHTPQKGRKESVSDDTPTKSDEKISQEPSTVASESRASARRELIADSESRQISDKSSGVKNKSTKESDNTQLKTPPKQENVNNSASPGDSASKPKTASAKKSRRRLAANLNFQ